jgi:hypothetical protein
MDISLGCGQGAYQVHVDVAEAAAVGYRDMLWLYLDVAVNLGLLAV